MADIPTWPTSPFLRLPRELRNRIYEFTITEVPPFPDGYPDCGDPLVMVDELPTPNLLRVSTQIHDEMEQYLRPWTALNVDLNHCDMWTLDTLDIVAYVPVHCLRQIKDVRLSLDWYMVSCANDAGYLANFALDEAEVMGPETIVEQWTPSKVLRKKLVAFLNRMYSHVHPDAWINVRIDLEGLPDPQDPFSWAGEAHEHTWWSALPFNSRLAMEMLRAFDTETIFGTPFDASLAWPPDQISVKGDLFIPRWCSLASNSAEVAEGWRAWVDREAGQIVRPQYVESKEMMLVILTPTEEKNSWQGFSPSWRR